MTPPNDPDSQERNIDAEVYGENIGEDVVGRDKHDNSIKSRIFTVFNSTKWPSFHLSFFSIHQQFNTKSQAKKISGSKENEVIETNTEQPEANNANDYKTQGVAVTTNRRGRIFIPFIIVFFSFTFFYYEYLKDNQEQRLQNWSKDALQEFQTGEELKSLKLAVKAGNKLNNPLLKKLFYKDYLTTAPIFALQQIIEQLENSIKELHVSQHPLWAISFNNSTMVAGGWDRKVYLCNISSIKNQNLKHQECSCNSSIEQKCEFDVEHTVTSIDFIPNSDEFVVATQDGRILISENMEIKISQENKRDDESKESAILSLSFNPNKEEIAAGRWDGEITIIDINENKREDLTNTPPNNVPVRSVSYHPNGKLVAEASEDGKIYLFDLSKFPYTHDPVYLNKDNNRDIQDRIIWSLNFSSDGKILVAAGEDGLIRLWEVSKIRNNEDKPLVKWDAEQDWVTSIVFAHEKNKIATAGWDGTVKLWDYSGNQLGEWNLKRPVTSLSFNAKGNKIVAAKLDGTVSYWKIETLQELLDRGNTIIEEFDNKE